MYYDFMFNAYEWDKISFVFSAVHLKIHTYLDVQSWQVLVF